MKIKEVLLEMYTAYVLDDNARAKLASAFPPKYSNFIGHHVTVSFSVPKDTGAPPSATIEVVGYVDSEDGLEALIVAVDDTTSRPDGSTYHITWSVDPTSGYKPKDSNTLIHKKDFVPVRPVSINTTPSVLK